MAERRPLRQRAYSDGPPETFVILALVVVFIV